MKWVYPLLLMLVVFSSGCSFMGGSTADRTDAIVVNSFSVDPQVLEPDDVASFFLDIENVGGTTATCIVSELFGTESWYTDTGSDMMYERPWRTSGVGFSYSDNSLSFSYWDANSGFVSSSYSRNAGTSLSSFVSSSWSQFSSGFCNSASGWARYSEVKYYDSMKPAVPSQNKPGQSFIMEWRMKPPVLPEGVRTTYPVTARTSYSYTTNAHINLQAFNKAEEQRREVLGEAGSLPIVVETSYASPIQIVATRGVNPIIVNQRQSGYELVNYLFEFQNTGSGWPLPFQSDRTAENGLIIATIELNGPGAQFYDCLGASSGTEIFVYGDQIRNLVKLRADKRAPFGCTIAIDRSQWADTPMGTVSLTFNLWYRYYTDAHTTVDVTGVQANY